MNTKLENAEKAFQGWKKNSIKDRIKVIKKVQNLLETNFATYAKVITEDMGKPIIQAEAEVKKCALVCSYYIENAETFLAPKTIKTEAQESFVTYEPLGVILGVMPWNFPFWQVFRFAIPTILAGNTVVVKHASNVTKSAQLIEDIFKETGCEDYLYTNLPIPSKDVEAIIANPIIKAITLTGSEDAGKAVSSTAAKYLKKSVLELGGSNAFIVLEDVDVNEILPTAINARMQNAGQSCIAGKRFLVQEKVYDAFVKAFIEGVKKMKFGDPTQRDTEIGPIAREDLAKEVEDLVNKSVNKGAKIALGGKRKDAYYEPTILTEVTANMDVFTKEVFGPVAPILKIKDLDEAIELSNKSEFGLGVSIFTKDIETVKNRIPEFNEGAVFINEMVKSDPRLPFGGIKKSGFGRELAENGIKEFVNVKTVYIK